MIFSAVTLAAAGSIVGLAHAATPDQWAQRSIYQIITDRFAQPPGTSTACNISNYCGGTWSGIIDQLDYIQGMGFSAIQISPVVENLPQTTIYGQAFHGYWGQNLYARNSHFGTDDDLKNLTAELHKRNMYLMVDIVANEMGYNIGDANMTATTPIDYSVFNPFNKASDYKSFCPITDWGNMTQVVDCWLGFTGVATPRIDTTNTDIQTTLQSWIQSLVGTFKFDGIRVDGAKQIETSFFQPFIKSAGVYSMAEVDDPSATFTCGYQNLTGGLENYPLYFAMKDAFTAGKMSELVDMVKQMNTDCASPQYLATFIENQDNPRIASWTNDTALASNAIAYTILSDGIPKIYYGQEQHLAGMSAPENRQPLWPTKYDTTAPLYQLIATLNRLRNHAISIDSNYVANISQMLYTDGSTYATRKGPDNVQIVAVFSNQGTQGGPYNLNVNGAAAPNLNMTEVTTCKTVIATSNGTITVPMNQGAPRVFFPTFQLKGSGLCGQVNDASSGVPNATTTASGASASSTSAADLIQLPMGLVTGLTFFLSSLLLW